MHSQHPVLKSLSAVCRWSLLAPAQERDPYGLPHRVAFRDVCPCQVSEQGSSREGIPHGDIRVTPKVAIAGIDRLDSVLAHESDELGVGELVTARAATRCAAQ